MSDLPGVFPATKKDGTTYYRSSVTFQKKHISLGSHSDRESAGRAYLDARHILDSSAFTIEDYSPESCLPFEKWVSLINFRDNGLYIKTPVYLKRRYFFYYYSCTICLKFDIDDLFYYSNHKIMKRGNHFFVSEFGMQTGLLTRCGIRSFAVLGRDYCFANGDPTDFRYGNLKIINPFHGVSRAIRNGRPVYTARIHINGTVLVGRYQTELEAAVAYNKAAELLRGKGIKKTFLLNYIPDVSQEEYSTIYRKVQISKKLRLYEVNPHVETNSL